jgi:SPX domain protein involved in polyphosphate accumulation
MFPTKTSESLRYERKYLICDFTHSEVEQIIKFHPTCFSEIFHERSVNNIYFDTPGMNNYFDNVEGEMNRVKVRIRWYGQLFGEINNAVLEYKIKEGLMGKKLSFPLSSFNVDRNFSKREIEKALNHNDISQVVKNEMLSLRPTLLNTYVRKYYLSADKRFRITIDHHMTYYNIRYSGNTLLARSVDYNGTVLEFKYDSSAEEDAGKVSSLFPFRLTKNSKYLQGLERIFL